jgi:hypothetical protein
VPESRFFHQPPKAAIARGVNRSRHAILVPLFAVLALLCCLIETASAAFNPAAKNPHFGEFLLWESEASTSEWLQPADPARGNGEWIYDSTLGVPAYVRQNPWTSFDPEGLQGIPTWETQEAMSVQVARQISGQAGEAKMRATYAEARKIAIPATAAVVAATGVTIASAGAAAPLLASAGLTGGTLTTTTAVVAGAAGGAAGQGTSNVLRGRAAGEGVPRAALIGATVGGVFQGGANAVQGFRTGLAEGAAITTSTRVTAATTSEMVAAETAAAKDTLVKYHYTTAPEASFAKGLREQSSVTDKLYADAVEAGQKLGIPTPNKVIPIQDAGHFVPNKPSIVQPSFRYEGSGTDFTNPNRVPPEDILPARPIGGD